MQLETNLDLAPLQREYRSLLQSYAEEIFSECQRDGTLDPSDQVAEYTDSACIYTWDCLRYLLVTDNEDAWEDNGTWGGFTLGCTSISDLQTRIAYWAFRADLNERYQDHAQANLPEGADPWDPSEWAELVEEAAAEA